MNLLLAPETAEKSLLSAKSRRCLFTFIVRTSEDDGKFGF